MKMPSPAAVKAFRRRVRAHYARHGRHTLPWRKTTDPYRILVSEMMLQQTQVDRVIPKYRAFLKQFPTVRALACAPRRVVLAAWSGLGYNRRARFLHEAAQHVVAEHGGRFPQDIAALEALPGVGHYTARAVAAFAFNTPVVMIETNIRTVYLHEFFADAQHVPDSELVPIIERTRDTRNSREWYAALMDYGTHLKKQHTNPSRRSKHHTRQSAFKGSRRQLRGCIVRTLADADARASTAALARVCNRSREETQHALEALAREGMVRRDKRSWRL